MIYLASKKAYIILQKDNGQVLQSIQHDKLRKQIQHLTVYSRSDNDLIED